MELISKLTAVILLICIIGSIAKPFEESSLQNNEKLQENNFLDIETANRHFEKRSLDEQDGDVDFPVRYENAFDGPHRLRALPGFLH
ncbi:jg3691 [Pararge aegeria aegeria]|uniref:Jg3691 protein n=1 Tax=Pararge aegeria aegeria TaxID=348720 RepID=A0A8S4S2J0_9NEOP|nr:jg3691 [Pararge aegeria aegeria]